MNLFLAKRKIQILPEKSTIPFWFERSTWNFHSRDSHELFYVENINFKLSEARSKSEPIYHPLHLCTYSFSSFHQYTSCPLKFSDLSYPLASMYGIFTYIYPHWTLKITPTIHVGKYAYIPWMLWVLFPSIPTLLQGNHQGSMPSWENRKKSHGGSVQLFFLNLWSIKKRRGPRKHQRNQAFGTLWCIPPGK